MEILCDIQKWSAGDISPHASLMRRKLADFNSPYQKLGLKFAAVKGLQHKFRHSQPIIFHLWDLPENQPLNFTGAPVGVLTAPHSDINTSLCASAPASSDIQHPVHRRHRPAAAPTQIRRSPTRHRSPHGACHRHPSQTLASPGPGRWTPRRGDRDRGRLQLPAPRD